MMSEQRNNVPGVGVYESVPFNEYLAWPYVNNSSLGAMLKSPAHYKAAMAATDEPSDALIFGDFFHGSSLDPERLSAQFIIEPDLTTGIVRSDGTPYDSPKLTTEYKRRRAEFEQLAGTRRIVSEDWYFAAQQMLRNLWRNERSNAWLGHDGPAEVSLVWDEPTTGLRCKCRFDKLCHDLSVVADTKTTQSVCDFQTAIGRFSYHRQAAFYVDAAHEVLGREFEFGLIAVEKTMPFCVSAALLDEDAVHEGRRMYRKALALLRACRDKGDWPAPPNPDRWHLPAWAAANEPLELVVDGKTIQV